MFDHIFSICNGYPANLFVVVIEVLFDEKPVPGEQVNRKIEMLGGEQKLCMLPKQIHFVIQIDIAVSSHHLCLTS
jgi:hypothetical protein